MRIWIHTMYYLPEFGSAPILMNELAAYLAGRGHEVEVVTTIPRPPHNKKYKGCLVYKEQKDGFKIKRYRTNATMHAVGRLVAWNIYTFFTLINLFRVKKGDVLFLRLPPLQLGVTGILGKLFKKAKVVLNVQDIHPDLSIESGILSNRVAIKLAQGFEKWIYKHSRNILVISDGFKKNLLDKGVRPEKVSIIPNWVDTDFLKPVPKDNPLSRKYGLHDRFVAMYSGTISISSISTLERILEAAKRLEKEQDILLVIVGEGLKKKELEEKAKRLGLKNVLFLPFQPYKDLPLLLGSADVLFVPLDKEKSLLSVPSKLYNFLAAGRPIMGMAHEDSEVKKIIEESRSGVCVSPGDVRGIASTIKELSRSGDRLKEMSDNARRLAVETYSKDKVLEDMEKYLFELQ